MALQCHHMAFPLGSCSGSPNGWVRSPSDSVGLMDPIILMHQQRFDKLTVYAPKVWRLTSHAWRSSQCDWPHQLYKKKTSLSTLTYSAVNEVVTMQLLVLVLVERSLRPVLNFCHQSQRLKNFLKYQFPIWTFPKLQLWLTLTSEFSGNQDLIKTNIARVQSCPGIKHLKNWECCPCHSLGKA